MHITTAPFDIAVAILEGAAIPIPGGVMITGSYDLVLVALSVVIATFASYAALDLAGRVTAARGWARSVWLIAGAAAMGVGIWSMHYVGMLAFRLPIPLGYDWPTVLLSLGAAILASAVALYVVSRRQMATAQALTGRCVYRLSASTTSVWWRYPFWPPSSAPLPRCGWHFIFAKSPQGPVGERSLAPWRWARPSPSCITRAWPRRASWPPPCRRIYPTRSASPPGNRGDCDRHVPCPRPGSLDVVGGSAIRRSSPEAAVEQ